MTVSARPTLMSNGVPFMSASARAGGDGISWPGSGGADIILVGARQLTGRLPLDEPLAPFGFARREALKTHCRPVEPPSASARLDIVPVHDGDPVLWCALVRAWAKARGRPPETLDPQIVRWRVASHCGQVRVRWRRRHEGGQHAVFGHCAHRVVRLQPLLGSGSQGALGPPGRTGPTRSAQQANKQNSYV